LSFIKNFSTDVLRRDLYSGMTALSCLCDESAHVFVPEIQEQQREVQGEQEETSMHDLLSAILEQELFWARCIIRNKETH